MKCIGRIVLCTLLILPGKSYSQNDTSSNNVNEFQRKKGIFGFVRGGLYTGTDPSHNDKPYISSVFSDFCLKAEVENGVKFKAFADLRFRYGVEFLDPVNRIDIREEYVNVNGKSWKLTAGQKIVKWGRADFTNPTSKLNPQNFISRSPDREDMDLGNLLSTFNWYPSRHINFEVAGIPFYRSSVLIVEPVPLPENVTIQEINSLITGREMFSYGLKTDIHLRGIDGSLSFFDGYDPMPGMELKSFEFDPTSPAPVPLIGLDMIPYKTRVYGFDFETAIRNMGIRGEAAYSVPYLSYKTREYVPLPELKWVFGMDWTSGIWRFTAEYSGKYIPDFIPAGAESFIGTQPDYSKLAELLAIPGFDPQDYIRQQIGSFNRLYNYQLKRYYHSAALRIESDLIYGKLTPSFFAMYNFSSRDLFINPEIRYKPADGLTITAGAEYYSGPKGSLYDIIDGFMNSVYVALKVDF